MEVPPNKAVISTTTTTKDVGNAAPHQRRKRPSSNPNAHLLTPPKKEEKRRERRGTTTLLYLTLLVIHALEFHKNDFVKFRYVGFISFQLRRSSTTSKNVGKAAPDKKEVRKFSNNQKNEGGTT